MHHYSGELIEEVLWAWRTCGAGAAGAGAGHAFRGGLFAAVWLHVEKLIETDVNSDLLPVVSSRPPGEPTRAEGRQSADELLVYVRIKLTAAVHSNPSTK